MTDGDRTDSPESVTTAVGTAVLFENEHVRVWEMVLGPDESLPLHRHVHDHVLIYPEPGRLRGRVEGVAEEIEQEVDEGWVYFRAVGPHGSPPHEVRNVGDAASRHYIVELKGPSVSGRCEQPEHNGRGRLSYPEDDGAR